MRKKSLQSQILNWVWHGVVILLSFASMIEAVFGFLPVPHEHEANVKTFFMGLTLIGAYYEIVNRLLATYYKKNNLLEMVETGLLLSKDN